MAEHILYACNSICGILWGPFGQAHFLFTGLLFSVGTGFFQFRRFRLWIRYTFYSLFKKEETPKKGISEFGALATVLAATVGTGNITGVAAALSLGGPGAIFWMWVSAFLGMMTAYAENVLGILFRTRDKNGNYAGGAMFYMEKGLRFRPFAVLFSFFCVLASFGMGNMAQMQAVSEAATALFPVSPLIVGALSAILLFILLRGGLSRLVRVTETLVPFMVLLFFGGSLYCLLTHASALPSAFQMILSSAFGARPAAGGFLGYTFLQTVRTGVSRGVFSNEAGLGSGVSVYAASENGEPCISGMWGIFAVFVDTIVVCTLTALVILTSGVYVPGAEVSGASLTAAAFEKGLGGFGSVFISVSTIFFAFATVLGWSAFGARSFSYLFGMRRLPLYRFLYILSAFLGSLGSMELVWGISDVFNALMAIPNLVTLLLLSPLVFRETRRFEASTLF